MGNSYIDCIFLNDSFPFHTTLKFRRSNEVAPEPGDAGNQHGSENDKDKQGDCQRAKQVPMNPGTGTWDEEYLCVEGASKFCSRTRREHKLVEMYTPD